MQREDSPTNPAIAIERPSTLRLAYWELLIALRSGGVRIALIVLALLLSIALALGVIRTQQRQADARLAEQENQQIKQLFDDVFEGASAPAEPTEPNSSRSSRLAKQLRMTARSPYMVSHSTNLWDVSLFPSPLSVLSVGASQTWPDLYQVHGISFAKTVQRSEQLRRVASAYGPFDAAFVVMAIAPLIIIGLTFNISSQDRESGLQKLIEAQTWKLGKLMALRCFIRAVLVIGVVICLVNGALLFAFGSQFDLNVVTNLLTWNVTATLYLLIWAALSLFVNSFAKSSATNGAALLLLWLILVLLIPRIVSNIVQEAVPTLKESQLVEREKSTFDQVSENADGLLARFQTEHPEIEISLDDEQQMALVRYLLAHDAAGDQAAENVCSHYSAQSLRTRYLNLCDWISPAISFRNQSDQCSGNSDQAFVAFSARAADIQSRAMEVFLLPSITNQQCTAETIAALPNLQVSDIPKRPSLLISTASIASMLVWLIIFLVLGAWKFQLKHLPQEDKLPQRAGVESA